MFFKVPGDVEIEVYPDAETLHDIIEEAIQEGAKHLEVHIQIIRRELLN